MFVCAIIVIYYLLSSSPNAHTFDRSSEIGSLYAFVNKQITLAYNPLRFRCSSLTLSLSVCNGRVSPTPPLTVSLAAVLQTHHCTRRIRNKSDLFFFLRAHNIRVYCPYVFINRSYRRRDSYNINNNTTRGCRPVVFDDKRSPPPQRPTDVSTRPINT